MIETTDSAGLRAATPVELAGLDAPDHLLAFAGEPWAFWRWSGLRGAGFPADLVLRLAVPACSQAADEVHAAQTRASDCRTRTRSTFRLAFEQSEDRQTRMTLSRALRQLDKGRVPDDVGDTFSEVLRTLASAYAQVDVARKAFNEQFAKGALGTSHTIRAIANDPRFREAVLMQNRAAIARVLRAFANTPVEKRGFKERQNEEMVASYLQRYCVKNDTIGFFGPVGWARLGGGVRDLAVSCGPRLVAAASTCFENWGIEALAERMAGSPAHRPWIAPRVLPEWHLEDGTLRSAADVITLSSQQSAILRLCDGETAARTIAGVLVGRGSVDNQSQVYELLGELAARNVVSWTYDLPLVLHPERRLRQLLNRIDDEGVRQPALAALDTLEHARNQVAAAFGNPEELGVALNQLEHVFEDVTGTQGSRLSGQMYAGRTLIYQDCRRDADVDVGPAVLDAIAPPLSLVLTSARWFSHRVASVCRAAFLKAHAMMAPRGRGGKVELLRFLKYAQLLLFSRSPATNILTPVVEELRTHWQRILGPYPDTWRVEYATAQLKPLVDELFAAPQPGWSLAHHHSPDVMIAAASVDAIRRGECYFVLGEVHVCANTLISSLFVSQHSRPEELCDAMASDLPQARPIIMFPRTFPRITNRSAEAWVFPHDYHIEVSRDTIHAGERSQAIPVSAFVVRNSGDRVVVSTRDGRLEFDAVEFFAELITRASLIAYDLVGVINGAGHNPRVTIDRLVVTRESWRFSARSLDFVHEEDEHARFLQARRWMRQQQLPRFVFFKVPVEVKPLYLDFDSPIYVEILVKMIRRVLASDQPEEPVLLCEMIPGHGELWLPDAAGNLYTSELRLVVKDLLGTRTC